MHPQPEPLRRVRADLAQARFPRPRLKGCAAIRLRCRENKLGPYRALEPAAVRTEKNEHSRICRDFVE
jgi:hypothetical protein